MTRSIIDPQMARDRIPGEPAAGLRHGLRRFGPEDAATFWMIDYRNPEGFTPLGLVHLELAYCKASELVANEGFIPGSDGFAVRLLGPFCYTAERPMAAPAERAGREERLRACLAALPHSFGLEWQTKGRALWAANRMWQARDLTGLGKAALALVLEEALDHALQVWTEHFRLMYPLLALQSAFYGFADGLEISRAEVADLLSGRSSTVTGCDLGLADLALRARAMAIAPLLDGPDWRQDLTAQGGLAAAWLRRFDDFLHHHGWRADVVGDPGQPSWAEDPERPMHHIRALMRQDAPLQKLISLLAARDRRAATLSAVRARLSTPERAEFDRALADMEAANFVWWQEDHNPLIDLAALLPLRKLALAAAKALRLSPPEDVFYLFADEPRALLRGEDLPELQNLIAARKAWQARWQDRRTALPRHFGPVPDRVDDAIYSEIEGLSPGYLAALRGEVADGPLHGTPACSGQALGRARVVLTDRDLDLIQPGEILVCEGSTPAWTPVFSRIAACLSDQGGTLSHTAIIAREYGLPCIVALGHATRHFRTGDLVRVDASKGTAERLETA
jgi:pyruvate,water dikinase